jgi:hypothetical protein
MYRSKEERKRVKALYRLCRAIFLEMSCLRMRVPADPNEVEHHLVAE